MTTTQELPEPMNATPHHSKVKVSIALADPTFVAGTHIGGKMTMECRADKGLGIGVIMVELFGVEELTSRDHSATTTFLHSQRIFQGPGLPPSNAVQAYPDPGDPPLPQDYHQARRGRSTFLFRLPLPENAPASVSFGGGLARVRYELRASVAVWWKGERRLVTSRCDLEVVEVFDYSCIAEPDVVVVAENGKFWMQGKVVGGFITAGESACVELQVKNHSSKKNTSLTLSLSRALVLASSGSPTSPTNPNLYAQTKQPLQITDTITTVPFRGPEYIIHPGTEGVASLVFDVPKHARSVKGGFIGGAEPDEANEGRVVGQEQALEALFEIRCLVEIKMGMGFTSKDITLSIPVRVMHPLALPVPLVSPHSDPVLPTPYPHPHYRYNGSPHLEPPTNSYVYPGAAIPLPVSPPIDLYLDNNQHVWMPPPAPFTPQPYDYHAPYAYQHPHPHNLYLQQGPEQYRQEAYYGTPPPSVPIYNPPYEYEPQQIEIGYINRPSSAGPTPIANYQYTGDKYAYPGLPAPSITSQPLLPLQRPESRPLPRPGRQKPEPEEGKGERALRVSQHLRLSSRHRSVSPVSHRYPFSTVYPAAAPEPMPMSAAGHNRYSPAHMLPPPPPLHAIDTNSLSISPSHSVEGVVHSPRPQLTPKHSFTSDRPKSVRVEELERLADEVGIRSRDLSGDLPKVDDDIGTKEGTALLTVPQPNLNKTLPGKPLPIKKALNSLLPSGIGPRLPDEKTPPTPTLTPLSAKNTRPSGASHPNSYSKGKSKAFLAAGLAAASSESGLDALERRLIAEVGTRKLDNADARPDVMSLFEASGDKRQRLPPSITIPSKTVEPLNDSAISSLTLADHDAEAEEERERQRGRDIVRAQGEREMEGKRQDREEELERLRARELEFERLAQLELDAEVNDHDSDVKTHRAGQSSMSGDSGRRRGRARKMTGAVDAGEKKASTVSQGANDDKKVSKKKERTREGGKMKSSKVRVAAWLGGIDTTVPPPEDIIPPSPSVARAPRVPEDYPSMTTSISGDPALDDNVDVSSAPNPRSSGFVAIGTLKQDSVHRPSTGVMTVVEEAKRIAEIWSLNAETNMAPDPVSQTRLRPDDDGTSTPMTLGDNAIRNLWKLPDAPQALSVAPPPPIKKTPENFMKFPQPYRKDPEVKPDIRSARGGRGGKVAAVASLWANAVAATEKAPADVKLKSKYDKKLDTNLGESSKTGRTASRKTAPSVDPVPHQPGKVGVKATALKDVMREPWTDRIQGPVEGATSAAFVRGTRAIATSKAAQKPLAAPLARKPNQLIKSTSVPAVISSSHAIPMLSSTASLARSQPLSPNTVNPVSATSVLSPVESTSVSSPPGPVRRPLGSMAFGQARLRDLIKKYQGQGT